MGKKVVRTQSSKKNEERLVKVLRPKVYITDATNFKRLIQELTGNFNGQATSTSTDTVNIKQVPVINLEEDYVDHGSRNNMEECLSFGSFEDMQTTLMDGEAFHDHIHEGFNFNDNNSNYNMDQVEHILALQEIETWLLMDGDFPVSWTNSNITSQIR